MLFQSKKKKITVYLEGLSQRTAFAELLNHYLEGLLIDRLGRMGIIKTEIHIDWLEDYHCINIQGRYGKSYVDIQVEETAFTIACDFDEPDDPVEYPLVSAGDFYRMVEQNLK